MSWDGVWEKIFQEQEWGKYPGEDLIRFIARNFYSTPNRSEIKLLEVGCGPGANLWYAAREGFTVYGVDGSATAINRASNRLERECPGWSGELVVGDILQLPFPDDFFDAVIDSEAVYCNSFRHSQEIYNEMARVTKKGGKLFSRTFATGSWGDQTGEKVEHNSYLVNEGPLAGKGVSRFTDYKEIHELIQRFEISEIQLITRKYMAIDREVKEWVITGEKR
ncbi:class I SAM-dependent methyltransferase [Brevibacillus centrosporus]|uniref:class I SAM-dependent methyltransferase n=1 Tax=Brevibacillus centrosporus TaxID=54910 RepID=UPI0039871427